MTTVTSFVFKGALLPAIGLSFAINANRVDSEETFLLVVSFISLCFAIDGLSDASSIHGLDVIGSTVIALGSIAGCGDFASELSEDPPVEKGKEYNHQRAVSPSESISRPISRVRYHHSPHITQANCQKNSDPREEQPVP